MSSASIVQVSALLSILANATGDVPVSIVMTIGLSFKPIKIFQVEVRDTFLDIVDEVLNLDDDIILGGEIIGDASSG